MTHLSQTLDAPVILNSSLPAQRKLLLLLLRCRYCLPIHKDKVSWWPLMAPAWVPRRPLVAPLRVFSLLSPPAAITWARPECGGGGGVGWGGWGLYGCFEKMCEIGVWVLRVLAQLGVYCAEGWAPYWHPWSPPLTQKLCSAPCVFFVNFFLTTPSPSLSLFFPPHSPRARCLLTSLLRLSLALSQSQGIWRVLRSPALLFQLTGFRPLRLMAVSGDDERSLMQCFPRLLLYGCSLEAPRDRAAKSMRTTSSVVFRGVFWKRRFLHKHKWSHFLFHVTVPSCLRHPTSWSQCCFKTLVSLYVCAVLVERITVKALYFNSFGWKQF